MSSRLPWFKHYRNAHTGSSFRKLRAQRDFETMACYWLLLELLSFHEDENNRGYMEIPHEELHQTFNVNSSRCTKVCTKLRLNFADTISIERTDKTYKVSVSNWLNYQENRGVKKQKRIEINPGEERREKREERVRDPNPEKIQAVGDEKSEPISKIDLNALIEEWGETLGHFGNTKDPKFDDSALARLLSRHGFEKTRMAIIGARYEESTKTFTPAKHLSLSRISKPEIFDKLINLGSSKPQRITQEQMDRVARGDPDA